MGTCLEQLILHISTFRKSFFEHLSVLSKFGLPILCGIDVNKRFICFNESDLKDLITDGGGEVQRSSASMA